MKKINKLSNLLTIYIKKLYKILYMIKMKMNVCVLFSLKIWTKQEMDLFHKYEH